MRYFDHYGTKKNVPVQIIRLINTYNRLYSFVNGYRLDNELIVCLRWMNEEEKKNIKKFAILRNFKSGIEKLFNTYTFSKTFSMIPELYFLEYYPQVCIRCFQ